jgi:tetratricopeptide (TPR) repeat protein
MKRIQLLYFLLIVVVTELPARSSEKIDSLSNLALELFSRNFDSTLYVADLMIEEGKTTDNTFAVVRGLYFKAYINDEIKGNSYKAIIQYLEATKYYELHPQVEATYDVASIYENLGRNFTDYGQLEIALDFFAKAYNRYDEIENLRGRADVLMYQAETYIEMKDTLYAFDLIDSSLSLSNGLNHVDLARIYNEAGIRAESLNLFQKALNYYTKSYEVINKKKIENKEEIKLYTFAIHNIGKINSLLGEYENAKRMLNQSEALFIKYSSYFTGHNFFDLNRDFAQCYFLSKNYDSAIFYYEKTHQATANYNVSTEKKDFKMYEQAAIAFEKVGNLEKSIEYGNLYKTNLEIYLERKEVAQREHEKLNMDLILQKYFSDEESNPMEARFYWFGGIATLIILILVGLIVRSSYKKQQLKRLLEYDINRIKKG